MSRDISPLPSLVPNNQALLDAWVIDLDRRLRALWDAVRDLQTVTGPPVQEDFTRLIDERLATWRIRPEQLQEDTVLTSTVVRDAITALGSARNDAAVSLTTSFAAIDSITVTTLGGEVLIWLTFFLDTNSAGAHDFRILRDGTVLVTYSPAGTDASFTYIEVDPVVQGVYTYSWQGRILGGVTATVSVRRFIVQERKR